jgi:hypothetical protein
MPATPFATDRAGKPLNNGDAVTIIGTITAVSGTGPTATLTVTLAGSGVSVSTVQGQDIAASTQTL